MLGKIGIISNHCKTFLNYQFKQQKFKTFWLDISLLFKNVYMFWDIFTHMYEGCCILSITHNSTSVSQSVFPTPLAYLEVNFEIG
jgi:hypothetical protein